MYETTVTRTMKRSDFHYDLPPDLIAQEPRPRGGARMMIVTPRGGGAEIVHGRFGDFPSQLSPGDVLVLNDTKVVPARLFAEPLAGMQRPVEVLLVHRLEPLKWECLCKPARRVRPGNRLVFSPNLEATVVSKNDEGMIVIRFEPVNEGTVSEEAFWSEVDRIGQPPLPPYIHRDAPRAEDRETYQTVYAANRGAIAAPTAGLHFNNEILGRIEDAGVDIVRVTLHVGIGTFAPVKAEDLDTHQMHSEEYEIGDAAARRLNAALDAGDRIVAVGTTTVRALESAILAGEGRFVPGRAETSIFIRPGFRFRAISAMLTNFHLPESTLLVLVSAFAGVETIRAAYREAIEERYLFYSYGDCMFLSVCEERRALVTLRP